MECQSFVIGVPPNDIIVVDLGYNRVVLLVSLGEDFSFGLCLNFLITRYPKSLIRALHRALGATRSLTAHFSEKEFSGEVGFLRQTEKYSLAIANEGHPLKVLTDELLRVDLERLLRRLERLPRPIPGVKDYP